MRKCVVSVLMISLLLLAGCGARQARLQEDFAAFRASLTEAEIAARVRLTADYGDTVSEYLLAVTCDGRQTVVTVEEPALIAGVQATVRWGEASMTYDGVMLAAGTLDGDGLTPVSAMPAVLDALMGGYLELLWREDDFAVARLYVTDSVVCTVWMDGETLAPASAELSTDGRTVVVCQFLEWAAV